MNLVLSTTRNRLAVSNVSSLLFVKINGPPLEQFDVLPYVQSWLLNHSSAIGQQARRPTNTYQEMCEDKSILWELL